MSLFLQKMRELSVKVETLEMTKGKGPDKVPGAVIMFLTKRHLADRLAGAGAGKLHHGADRHPGL